MKICDFEKKGNVVRFYLTDDECNNYWGDDFNDKPYEHNAGRVYDEYIKGWVDVALPYDYSVLEPADDWHYDNSPFSKEDMINHKTPCIIAVKTTYDWDACFSQCVGDANAIKFYFNDPVEKIEQCKNLTVLER